MNPMIESVMNLHRCEDCPIRCHAAKKPRSIFARIHHWHKTWWPGWKIYQKERGSAIPRLALHTEA
jgi:hypothetical protein